MAAIELPLFPLKTVLFPGGSLPLRVFEPRYLDMISACLGDEREFGVVLIRAGEEVGVSETFDVGTVAQIIDWYRGRDGLFGVTVQGRGRFEVLQSRRQVDGLYVATVEPMDAEPSVTIPDEYQSLTRLLRDVLDGLGEHYQSFPRNFDDASWVGYRLSEILPLSLTTKQRMLELTDSRQRLALLHPYVKEAYT